MVRRSYLFEPFERLGIFEQACLRPALLKVRDLTAAYGEALEHLSRPVLRLNRAPVIHLWLEVAQEGLVLADIVRSLCIDIYAFSKEAVVPGFALRVGGLRDLFHRRVRPVLGLLLQNGWIQLQSQGRR